VALTFFNPLPCTAGYQGTKVRNGLDTAPGPAVNTNARCTSPARSGIDVRGSAHAPAPSGLAGLLGVAP
jgi:phospholipid/cholesterol/gamma-HCH transport system substrate-binding protein